MGRFRRIQLWVGVALLGLLIAFSIYGAFLGADRAREFFNSVPLAVYFCLLTLSLALSILSFPRMLRSPGRLLMHLGPILILVGSIINSSDGHRLAQDWFGVERTRTGTMVLRQGVQDDAISGPDGGVIGQLPFALRLNRFWIEYYPAEDRKWLLMGQVPCSEHAGEMHDFEVPWQTGGTYDIPETDWRVRVLEYISRAPPPTSAEPDAAGKFPAMRLEVFREGQSPISVWLIPDMLTGYAQRTLELICRDDKPGRLLLSLSPPEPAVRQYKADVDVVKDGQSVRHEVIEVNKPLHYGGYHFYQSSFDPSNPNLTILAVHSDLGLHVAYTGFLLMVAGMFWMFWAVPVFRYVKGMAGHAN